MTTSDIEALRVRDPGSLSLDEAGILYLWTRDKIRAFEAKAKRREDTGGGTPDTNE